jgi:hypothetical protein
MDASDDAAAQELSKKYANNIYDSFYRETLLERRCIMSRGETQKTVKDIKEPEIEGLKSEINRDGGGDRIHDFHFLFSCGSSKMLFEDQGDEERLWELDETPPRACDICGRLFEKENFFVDGKLKDNIWGNMCIKCFLQRGMGLGYGQGQLYVRGAGKWLLIAGLPE